MEKLTKNQNTLSLVTELLDSLDAEKVTYCHWKSNNALAYSASGENDLDLLVKRSDGSIFLGILHKLGFKQAFPSADKTMPGVLDYYGFDFNADKFVHVHVHFQLILGHDATKNYSLPLERIYFDSSRMKHGFRVPSSELEFVVLVIRLILKHSTWDTSIIMHGKLSKAEKKELAYLKDQVDYPAVIRLLQDQLPFFEEKLFAQCLNVLELKRSLLIRLLVGERVKRVLYPYSRRSQLREVVLKIWRRITLGVRRKILRKKGEKPRLSNGGAMIAVLGGDGAGKSTAIEGIYNWLSSEFDVQQVHLGKPPRSSLTRLIQYIRRYSRKLVTALKSVRAPRRNGVISNKSVNSSSAFASKNEYARLMWDVSVGRDRYKTYSKAKRFSMNGGIVICDRFPLPDVIKLMDAPQVELYSKKHSNNGFTSYLSYLEKRWYGSILLPDLMIVLKLDPKLAVSRKTNEESLYVEIRSTEVWTADFQNTPAVVIDASLTKEEVLLKIKQIIWSHI